MQKYCVYQFGTAEHLLEKRRKWDMCKLGRHHSGNPLQTWVTLFWEKSMSDSWVAMGRNIICMCVCIFVTIYLH